MLQGCFQAGCPKHQVLYTPARTTSMRGGYCVSTMKGNEKNHIWEYYYLALFGKHLGYIL